MSRTYRKTNKGKWSTQGKVRSQYKELDRKYEDQKYSDFYWNEMGKIDYLAMSYSKAPSHWNHEYHTKPRRAKERQLLKKILTDYVDYDNVTFPDGKKPTIYYW